VLDDLRHTFRLGGLVLRHGDGRLVCAVPPGHASRSAPEAGLRLPEGGGRLRLGAAPGSPSLDLWEGDEKGLSVGDRRALAVAIAMLALALRLGPTPGTRRA
jgi:hypothetical protein